VAPESASASAPVRAAWLSSTDSACSDAHADSDSNNSKTSSVTVLSTDRQRGRPVDDANCHHAVAGRPAT